MSVTKIERQTVDLSSYPDLVVIYLGMRVRLETAETVPSPVSEESYSS